MGTQFNKALILPIITFIALNVKMLTGYDLPNEYVDLAADTILAIVSIVGMFMHPKKEK